MLRTKATVCDFYPQYEIFFFQELHLKGLKHSVVVVNDTEVAQTDHQPKPENSAGDAQTHHPVLAIPSYATSSPYC